MQEPRVNEPKGRQTLCNLYKLNDFTCIESIENSKSLLLNNFFQKDHKKLFVKHFTSFETAKRVKKNSKLYESVECQPLVKSTLQRNRAQTCRKRSKTCITNQSHVKIQTSNATTKTPTPNCDYRQLEKTYSSSFNDGNNDCINKNINKNSPTEWYIVLASNCYRNGFQLHVNHLDECSKNLGELERKPAQAVILRLPLSALFFRSPSPLPPSITIESSESVVSLMSSLVVCSSSKSIKSASLCDKTYSSNLFSDKIRVIVAHIK